MENSRCRFVFATLLIAAVALILGIRTAEAAPKCGAAGATCKMNRQCCSSVCVGASPTGRPSGTCSGAGGANGSPCTVNSNCTSNYCVAGVCCNTACNGQCDGSCSTGNCLPIANGTPCDDGQFCTANDACLAGACMGVTGQTCTSPCPQCIEASDGCASEGDLCGREIGEPCYGTGHLCDSGYCRDGVCCDTDCSGNCEACSAAKTGGVDGTCSFIQSGSDPDNECDADPGCGGACDGAGACDVTPSGFSCDDGVFCTTGDQCDGAGNCDGSGSPCDSQCPDCDEEADGCGVEGFLCGQETGASCSFSAHCASTYCVDGFCCNSPCDGPCEACSQAKNTTSDGNCGAIPSNTDPDDECNAIDLDCGTGNCNGLGGCDYASSDTPCNDTLQCSQTDRCDGAGDCRGTTDNGCPGGCQCESSDNCVFEGNPCLP